MQIKNGVTTPNSGVCFCSFSFLFARITAVVKSIYIPKCAHRTKITMKRMSKALQLLVWMVP